MNYTKEVLSILPFHAMIKPIITKLFSNLFIAFAIVSSACSVEAPNSPQGITLENQTDSVVFAVIGDYGSAGDAENGVADLVKSWNPDFILTTGDNNYPSGRESTLNENIGQYYGDYIYNWDAPYVQRCNGAASIEQVNRFFPSPGNHDVNSSDGLTPYLNYFTLPGNEQYYRFIWGPIGFYSLNSTADNMDEQFEWLSEQLKTDNTAFHIVYFHHSPYSPGSHGNSEKMQWDYLSHGVDVVLTGHDHIYARIQKKNETGMYYLITGAGGRSLYTANNAQLDANIFNVFSYVQNYGAVRGKANSMELSLEYFSIADDSTVIDRIIFRKL